MYRPGVRVGNWHEDNIAQESANKGRAIDLAKFQGTTEARTAFVAPQRQQPKYQPPFPVHTVSEPVPASQKSMPKHLLFGHGFDAHDTNAVSKDAFMSVSQAAHSGTGIRTNSIIKGSKGTTSMGAAAPQTRTHMMQDREKRIAAGIDSTDPRGAQGASNPKPTPVAFSGGGQFTTMNNLTQKPVQQSARLARKLGHTTRGADTHDMKPRNQQFTRSFGDRTANVLMRR